ncbi:two-component system chemotaxis sensor kinase CheA [Sphaerotilus hippei]|uniref:Chemotaxis protein CheA n=1 Tax=Sphaerotilus hippei TaxID=744406 RepID=A0A318H396_9BURK|nr:chemotaxis protein CheA [Sphaerotilus hippei]PXW98007.1 two-component system chemotaxis sensor kinase CheA [Sphaerotilus hippei]
MKQTELLEQFVLEARECLEQIGQRLLEVEQSPTDTALLNDLFRQVHTLKGNCGLFEFKPLERVVHAGEDLLDRVRNKTLPYGTRMADTLLDAMDFTALMIDQIEASGEIDASFDERSQALARSIREHLDRVDAEPAAGPGTTTEPPATEPVAAPITATAPAAAAPPDWLSRLPPDLLAAHPGAVALRYLPEPECFFKGEDPWRLAQLAPGLLHLDVAAGTPWPDPAELDCYRCNLDLLLLSSAPAAYLQEHFRYVPEQIELWDSTVPPAAQAPAAPAEAERAAPAADPRLGELLKQRTQQLWNDQIALLSRPTLPPGTAAAARQAVQALLGISGQTAALEALAALPADAGGPALLAFMQQHGPQGEPEAVAADAPRSETTRRIEDPTAERHGKVLKVNQEKIDRLMDLIGEMVVAKNALPYLATRAENVFNQRELAREIKAQYAVINRIAEDMQHAIMQVRMMPVGVVFQRFSRLVRDISRKLGKEVQLLIEGEDTEADKNVIEALADPLIHIVRNSLDHGIERPEQRRAAGKPALGTIRIRAHQESDRVVIEIADDGAGVNTQRVRAKAVERGLIPADKAATLSEQDAVQLVFLPGFSTTDTISDLSGRGVGMDVVRSAIENLNGQVSLTSVSGEGSTLRLSLPLSMAVTNVMIIETAGRRFGVPMDMIVETVRVHADDIHRFKQAATTVLRSRIVPLRPLNQMLSLTEPPRRNDDGEFAVLVVRLLGENVGLMVDDFHGATDIILKPLEGVLAGLTGFAGTALMGDGSVLMVLNPKELI